MALCANSESIGAQRFWAITPRERSIDRRFHVSGGRDLCGWFASEASTMSAIQTRYRAAIERVPEAKAGARGSPAPPPAQASRWRSRPQPQNTGVLGF